MNLMDTAQLLGNFGEFFGAIAVVATLAYLAVQIKQSTKVARSTVRQSITDSITSMAASLADSDDLARLVQKGIDGAPLEPHEQSRLGARCYVAMRRWENIYFQHLDGLVTTEEWAAYRQNLKLLFKNRTYQEYWSGLAATFSPGFQAEVRLIYPAT